MTRTNPTSFRQSKIAIVFLLTGCVRPVATSIAAPAVVAPEPTVEASAAPLAEPEAPSPEQHPCFEGALDRTADFAAEAEDREREGNRSAPYTEPFEAAHFPDLDGDGLPELNLTPKRRRYWPHILFGSRDCRVLGEFWDADIDALNSSKGGYRDLLIHSTIVFREPVVIHSWMVWQWVEEYQVYSPTDHHLRCFVCDGGPGQCAELDIHNGPECTSPVQRVFDGDWGWDSDNVRVWEETSGEQSWPCRSH